MAQNKAERWRELRRKRKRYCKRRKLFNKKIINALSIDKEIPKMKIIFGNRLDFDWTPINDFSSLVQKVPYGVKTKIIWPQIPEDKQHLKDKIIKMVLELSRSKLYVGPSEWDGSFKHALKLIQGGRLPRGFQRYFESKNLLRVL